MGADVAGASGNENAHGPIVAHEVTENPQIRAESNRTERQGAAAASCRACRDSLLRGRAGGAGGRPLPRAR